VRGGLSITRAGSVIAGTYGPRPRVVALDPGTGAELWSFAVRGSGAPELGIHGAPLEDGAGTLYFGAQDDDVYALDPAGKLLFRFHTGGDVDAPLVLGPAPDEPPESGAGLLFVGSDDGHLYGLR
jgi:outer membrane protein assembly factor BamB